GRPAPGAGPAAGSSQHAARPPAVGRPDAGTAPPRPAAAEAAGAVRGADGAAAPGRGARDLHPAGGCGRDGQGGLPDVSRGQEASGPVPAAGREHRARVADRVPERPRPEALALQVVERLTRTGTPRLAAAPADIWRGDAVAAVIPSGPNDALSIRT